MIRPELGTKCTCSGCGERFYDLARPTAPCPKCGEARLVRPPRVSRPARKPAEMLRFGPRARPVAEEPDADAEVEVEVEAEEADEAEDDDVATLTPDAADEEEDAIDDIEREVVRPGPVD